MTPRAYLLAEHVGPDSPAAERERLGLAALAACVGCAEAFGVVLPGVDAEHATADDARRALPHVLRAALDGLAAAEGDARGAHVASGHGHRHVAALHRTAWEACQALAFHLHAAARVAGVGIAAREGDLPREDETTEGEGR